MLANGTAHYSHSQAQYRQQAQVHAKQLYHCVYDRSWIAKLWQAVTDRNGSRLLSLPELLGSRQVQKHSEQRLRSVSLQQIVGSANGGRCQDFDSDFRPLQPHNQSRWIGVATARQQGMKLAPVTLVQMEDCYFVVDGHHRISVSKALGQTDIEAKVTVWEVE